MAVKKFSLPAFLKKSIFWLIIFILAYSLETFILSLFMEKIFEACRLLIILMPVSTLVSSVSTLFILYYGIRIVISLKKSQKFREENANGNELGKNQSLCSVLVTTMACIQTIKWIAQIVRLIWSLAKPNAFKKCAEEGIIDQPCVSAAFHVFKYLDVIMAVYWYSVIEFLFVVFPVIPIKIGAMGRFCLLKLSKKTAAHQD